MTLQQMIESIDRKSYRSRTRQDIIEAINGAARRVYNWIVKETPGRHFLKWDTSISFIANTDEYQLPADCKQIVRIRELDPGSGKWFIVNSTDLADVGNAQEQFSSVVGFSDDPSQFKFYGPYEKGGSYYIQFAPHTTVTRQIEIVYSASFVEIDSAESTLMIPEEAHEIVKNYALAECLEDNDDSLSREKEARADKDLPIFFAGILRQGQVQDTPKQEAYL